MALPHRVSLGRPGWPVIQLLDGNAAMHLLLVLGEARRVATRRRAWTKGAGAPQGQSHGVAKCHPAVGRAPGATQLGYRAFAGMGGGPLPPVALDLALQLAMREMPAELTGIAGSRTDTVHGAVSVDGTPLIAGVSPAALIRLSVHWRAWRWGGAGFAGIMGAFFSPFGSSSP